MKINLLKKHAKSFYWASFFLDKAVFKKSSTLYNFCRTLDDIVDDENKLEIKKEYFFKFKKDFTDKNSDNLIISFNSKYLLDIASEVENKNLKLSGFSFRIYVIIFEPSTILLTLASPNEGVSIKFKFSIFFSSS